MTVALTKIGPKIRRLRLAAGMTQKVLASRAGISGQTVWNLESGRCAPSTQSLAGIASALNVEPGALLCASLRGSHAA